MLLSALKHHMKELNLEAVDISLVRKTPGLQGCVVHEIQFIDSYVKLVWAQLSSTHLCFWYQRRSMVLLDVDSPRAFFIVYKFVSFLYGFLQKKLLIEFASYMVPYIYDHYNR